MLFCIKCQWMVCASHLWSDYFPPCQIKDQTFLVFSLTNQPIFQCNLACMIVTSHGVKVGKRLLLQVNNLQRWNSTKVCTCGVIPDYCFAINRQDNQRIYSQNGH